MYTGAQQFIHNRDNAAARTQLQMLWQDAPYYGDPSGMSTALGLPAALNYEQAIAAEQVRLEQERAERERQERERQERERIAQEQQGRERQERERLTRLRQERVVAKRKRNKQFVYVFLVLGTIVGGIGGLIIGLMFFT